MKNKLLLLFFVMAFNGCTDEVQFNIPAIQGIRDGELWRAETYKADIDFGGLIIEGSNGGETLTLVCTDDGRGTYNLGGNSLSEARFVDAQGVVYSSLYAPADSLSVYPSDGQIVVESFDNSVTPKTVTGTFRFNAYTSDGLHGINFIEGHFYRVSLTGGIDVPPLGDAGLTCIDAHDATNAAALNFYASNLSSTDYTMYCTTYKEALMLQINLCGDTFGDLQATIDGLGDCIQ